MKETQGFGPEVFPCMSIADNLKPAYEPMYDCRCAITRKEAGRRVVLSLHSPQLFLNKWDFTDEILGEGTALPRRRDYRNRSSTLGPLTNNLLVTYPKSCGSRP